MTYEEAMQLLRDCKEQGRHGTITRQAWGENVYLSAQSIISYNLLDGKPCIFDETEMEGLPACGHVTDEDVKARDWIMYRYKAFREGKYKDWDLDNVF